MARPSSHDGRPIRLARHQSRQTNLCRKSGKSGARRVQECYRFVHGDIGDSKLVDSLLLEEKPDAIVYFAAESHMGRSILSSEPVIDTSFRGTFTMLEGARRNAIARFGHVSTDEAYSSLAAPAEATEEFPLNPSSPYSASKAGSGLLAHS
jgi:dTDP-glucose 4,6-dehydratase